MGIISTYLEEKLGTKRFTLADPEPWFVDWARGGEESSSGVPVNENSALKYTPFWAGVRVITGTLAATPCKVYRRLERGKEPVNQHPVFGLLHLEPNPYMDALTFIETRQAHALCYGNGYAEIQRNGAGKPIALWPLLPNRTSRKIKDGVPFYEIRLQTGEAVHLPDANVLHIKGLGFDGYTGYNVVQYQREALGFGIAVKRFGARFFKNDASPGGVLEHPTTLSDKAFSHLKESWAGGHGGLENAHRMQILEEGMKWSKTGVDPEQAQALEVQKWNVDDSARILQIPPHKIGSMEYSKYNNVEQLQIDFVCTTMLYWIRKWEQDLTRKLFTTQEKKELFCEFLIEGLLRGDVKSRYMAYNIGRNAGFLCADDIREKENMNPLPDGKGQIFLQPMNMVPLGEAPAIDSARTSLRTLLMSQWSRIIAKQMKSLEKNNGGFDWVGHRRWAFTILAAPTAACASLQGRRDDAEAILNHVLQELLTQENHLETGQEAILADRLIERIGGHHG